MVASLRWPPEDMACLVAKGGVDMEIDLSVHFRNIAHDRGDFQHTGKLVGIEFLFLGVKYADNGVVGSTKADDRTGLDLFFGADLLEGGAKPPRPFPDAPRWCRRIHDRP